MIVIIMSVPWSKNDPTTTLPTDKLFFMMPAAFEIYNFVAAAGVFLAAVIGSFLLQGTDVD